MAINALYKEYFQKSKIFMYPLLGIKRGSPALPSQTCIAWNDEITPEDAKLIAIYPIRHDEEYSKFEKTILLKHNRLIDYYVINDESYFIFDFNDLKDDWNHFINGKYSKISTSVKRKIHSYFDNHSANHVYMDSYLNPEKYFSIYSDLLDTSEELLRSIGELCSKPDLEKETIFIKKENLQNNKILG
jgi:hypothetical protein